MKRLVFALICGFLVIASGFPDQLDPGDSGDNARDCPSVIVARGEDCRAVESLIMNESGTELVILVDPPRLVVPSSACCPSVVVLLTDGERLDEYLCLQALCDGDPNLVGKMSVRLVSGKRHEAIDAVIGRLLVVVPGT